MAKHQLKLRSKSHFSIFSLFIFLLIIFILVLINFFRETIKYFSIRKEIKRKTFEIEALEARSLELKNLKEYLETEFYKEKEARERLGFMKAGKKLIYLPLQIEKKEEYFDQEAKKIEKRDSGPYFKNWWQYFLK